jgi:hypothetical protein
MSKERKNHLEEEFEKHYSSGRGAWTNAWSPTWEDTTPPESSYFGNPWEDFSAEEGYGDPDKEETS